MLDAALLEAARLLFQVGGGVAWVLLFTLSWKMLTIIESVVKHDREYGQQAEEESSAKGAT